MVLALYWLFGVGMGVRNVMLRGKQATECRRKEAGC